MSEHDRSQVQRIPISCRVCGRTGLAYQENAFDGLTEEGTREYRYWVSQGMWANAETQLQLCDDHYELSSKNMFAGDSPNDIAFKIEILKNVEKQAQALHELGLSSSDSISIAISSISAALDQEN